MQILRSYPRYMERLLNVLFLVFLCQKPRRKDWVTTKKYKEKFVCRTSLFWLHVLFPMSFFVAFSSNLNFKKKKKITQENGGRTDAPPTPPPSLLLPSCSSPPALSLQCLQPWHSNQHQGISYSSSLKLCTHNYRPFQTLEKWIKQFNN